MSVIQLLSFFTDLFCFIVLLLRMRTINALTKKTKYNLFKIRMTYLSVILFYDIVMVYYVFVHYFFVDIISWTTDEQREKFVHSSFNSIMINICYSRGIFIPLLRFIEPIYRQRLVDKVKYFASCGCL